mmetsp:Transcript_81869/g.226914  ORF Transcript_81869/g.226914 Transcript_81869/m.226914 type:complete len:237 (+) Transcript_81869:175-885(+)
MHNDRVHVLALVPCQANNVEPRCRHTNSLELCVHQGRLDVRQLFPKCRGASFGGLHMHFHHDGPIKEACKFREVPGHPLDCSWVDKRGGWPLTRLARCKVHRCHQAHNASLPVDLHVAPAVDLFQLLQALPQCRGAGFEQRPLRSVKLGLEAGHLALQAGLCFAQRLLCAYLSLLGYFHGIVKLGHLLLQLLGGCAALGQLRVCGNFPLAHALLHRRQGYVQAALSLEYVVQLCLH